MISRHLLALALALLLGGANPSALACGYDGMAVDLTAAHPASLPVALAIHDAYKGKLIARPIPLQGGFGMRRALLILDSLRVALSSTNGNERFNLLLVEPGLWARFEQVDNDLQMTAHSPRPAPEETVVIIGEGVLIALENGKLSVDRALSTGVLRIQSGSEPNERLASHWRQAFDTSDRQQHALTARGAFKWWGVAANLAGGTDEATSDRDGLILAGSCRRHTGRWNPESPRLS
ncbi:MAG: hypothetical protein ACRERX_15530 [Pseudomonas sp.]